MNNNSNELIAVIFDFDNTIAPTDCLERFRTTRDEKGLEKHLREQELKLFDGIEYLFNHLCHNQIPLAIVTNSPRWYINRLLDHFIIPNHFDAVISYDDVGPDNKKPSSKGITLALEKMGLKSSQNILYVGDDKNDVIAAYRAGIKPIIGKWTISKEPISYMPAGVFSINDLVDMVMKGVGELELLAEVLATNSGKGAGKPNVLPLDQDSKLVYHNKDASIFSFGRYFPLSSEASASIHKNHLLTQHVLEKIDAGSSYQVPSYWMVIFREFIKNLEKFKNINFDIITVVPAKKDKVKRLEKMLSNIEQTWSTSDSLFLEDLFYFEDGTSSTKTLNRSERYVQIDKTLKVTHQQSSKIKGANIIVIDDVSTSGATLSSAIKTLYSYGANQVYGLCIAKTVSLPEDKSCPKCRTKLRIQTNKKTGGQFWYCPKKSENGKYLDHFTEDIKEKDCPKCGRPMFKRANSRDGSVFLGCSGFRSPENKCSHTEKAS